MTDSRIRLLFLLIPVFILLQGNTKATPPFEGVINFRIAYPGTKLTKSQLDLFPKTLTVMIKGGKSRNQSYALHHRRKANERSEYG
ncbi:MAG: hypothetical protein WCI48_10130, partial [Bacteroidota bacterium]